MPAKICGLCYEAQLHGTLNLRLHQDAPEHFVLEVGNEALDLTLDQLKALPAAVQELVSYITKRQLMVRNLLTQS